MPTYQYVCNDCGEGHEAVQKFSDDALTVCPACGGQLRKVYSAVGVVFKGSGFYRTDSRSGSSSAAGSTGSTGGDGGKTGDSGSTETTKPSAPAASGDTGASAPAAPAASPSPTPKKSGDSSKVA